MLSCASAGIKLPGELQLYFCNVCIPGLFVEGSSSAGTGREVLREKHAVGESIFFGITCAHENTCPDL